MAYALMIRWDGDDDTYTFGPYPDASSARKDLVQAVLDERYAGHPQKTRIAAQLAQQMTDLFEYDEAGDSLWIAEMRTYEQFRVNEAN